MLLKLFSLFTYFYRKLSYIDIGKKTIINPLGIKKFPHSKIKIGNSSIILGNLITQKKGSIIQISNNVYMGNSALISSKRISIGNNVLISAGSLITDNDGHSLNYMVRKNDVSNRLKGYKNWRQIREKAIRIEKNSWIGYGCIILKGVTIGEGSIVGAGSVVTTSVPPFTVVGGNPAKIIKKINK